MLWTDELGTIELINDGQALWRESRVRDLACIVSPLQSHINPLYGIIEIVEYIGSPKFRVDERNKMDVITISLSNDDLVKLQELASRHGITPEELAHVSIEELLTRPEEEYQRAVDFVLKKNAELYRRLA